MDGDIFLENKEFLYGDNILDELTKDYKWSSLLDATDASPSEILADAAPILLPPISPILSIKSSPTESSSDSGSEDDSKNSSSNSETQFFSSPEWASLDNELQSNLNLDDIEQFILKSETYCKPECAPTPHLPPPDIKRPVVAIENGIIKIERMKIECDNQNTNIKSNTIKCTSPTTHSQQENGSRGNAYFNVINENNIANGQVTNRIVVPEYTQKNKPNILKKSPTLVLNGQDPNNILPIQSTNGIKIAITPIIKPTTITEDRQNYVSPTKPKIVLSSNPDLPAGNGIVPPAVQNSVASRLELDGDGSNSPTLDVSNLTETEIRALKKHQRMIKNRESACQSRQKKKEYVTALEQQLLEAHQEIGRLRLENKLLKDQLETSCGRSRKMPRLDPSFLIPKKNIAVIFAMVFMVSLNFNMLGWSSNGIAGPAESHGTSRHLLWKEDSAETVAADNVDLTNGSMYDQDCNSTLKEGFFLVNQTESIRIAGELQRWIGAGKTLNWTYKAPKRRKIVLDEEKMDGSLIDSYKSLFQKLNLDNNLIQFLASNRNHEKSIRSKSHLRKIQRNKDIDPIIDYGTVYPKPLPKSVKDDFPMDDFGEWTSLLQALQRRDDTFYIVGVGRGEHLLLPAVTHNVTRPPKMALILPAKSGNDSVGSGHVTLMQIDCSVVNTTLVQLKSDAIPESLRKNVEQDKSQEVPSNRTNNESIDASLNNMLAHNINNVSNYQVNIKKPLNFKGSQPAKEDFFKQYLYSKYDEIKESVRTPEKVTNIRAQKKKRNV